MLHGSLSLEIEQISQEKIWKFQNFNKILEKSDFDKILCYQNEHDFGVTRNENLVLFS